MALQEIDAGHVRMAARRIDEMGRDEALRAYGFRKATSYVAVIDGLRYDSKALVGIAHEFATGRALSADQFTGGKMQVVPVLERLGFPVVPRESIEALRESDAFVLLWNPDRYNLLGNGEFEEISKGLDASSRFRMSWSTGGRTQGIEVGDRIYLRVTGTTWRGLVASGVATSEVYMDEPYEGSGSARPTPYIDVDWEVFLRPEDALPIELLKDLAPDSVWTAPGGGRRLEPELYVEDIWAAHLEALELAQPSQQFEGAAPGEIERVYREVVTKQRVHQRAFARLLRQHYPLECAVCGLAVDGILEAAHIQPDSRGGAATVENGRLMCPNHHRAFDVGLMEFEPEDSTFTWLVEPF